MPGTFLLQCSKRKSPMIVIRFSRPRHIR